ncbi:PREDICTED: cap-specific mRNA (nucleoside-2'-O-)-methyltransferase 1 [Vollenhovia emeryi]|uniref:cap-specific mRNA (nucleoside-2'-O-)-methyltransferase 1 n=1 Tax=Vollenhovia emeryi TaxID=411798 RepID=UPI0005F46B56|nr:PREDICTED: cap-specific mRNA (nucleoside-2'-O-)-methyltransferase 1 [Vollenhovia emeryi]XP_011862623.1 PREDICTED: cap-specific mRNA (nucleoside-2'-O-)-methyltransferase 1 [Vollenhovia emeryi]XP_011862624.1 PREDICTED: cap-specific mRNA (nucleoside-2'-O-)-methyltransferase 1 [Vollenhovia emeryi]XP_011862625.1 PREDICTED: cap-specific mRNA (nucleoside-2'-O-)-methyltransferase 1 [Vollenhovia emeryi]XP_011862626.1 PREDICTED: cap-specific mRNA (nucleoside-2'-O-)-methyltransferase 1 [Vollenhovia eme
MDQDDVEYSLGEQNGVGFQDFYESQSKRMKLNSGEAIGAGLPPGETYINESGAADNASIDGSKSNVSEKIQQMMRKMGYKPGKGLGKDDQGRVEPVKAATQRGRRGFGNYVPGLKEAGLRWNPEEEVIDFREDIKWLQNIRSDTPVMEDMTEWMKLGPKKNIIHDETMFCDPDILIQILACKTVFDKLDKVELRKARTRSNPYETIRTVNFLNRAAVKMANIDKACDLMFTEPKHFDPNELLYFADVCAGPGGFSEYVLSKKKWHAKGFGFTLKNENDFTLDEFFAGPCETFHPFYGSKDNGDVFDAQNQEEFRALVLKHTNGKGVHFMMSDGGFSVEGQENIQEILSKQLYLCQCLVALMIVRPGGHFVTKLFDLFTPFSAGLVYLMYKCFESICIFKPNSSRPANSERYLICKRKRVNTQGTMDYLSHVNHLLSTRDESNDVLELVPFDVLEADTEFFEYLRNSNNDFGRRQIVNLLKIAAFCDNPTLIEIKQAEMRKECLKHWNLHDQTRVRPQMSKPQDKIHELLGESVTLLSCEATKLKDDNVESTILQYQPYDWYCMPCGSGPNMEDDKLATFYLGLGRKKVYRYVRGKWESAGEAKIELPPDTLVYAELVYETKWTGKYFSKTRALHILDAYKLGGEDVSKKYLSIRYKLTKKFCDALWKPVPNDCTCVRAKERFMLMPDIHKRLRVAQRRVKLAIAFEFPKSPLECDSETDAKEPVYSAFNSVMFIRSTAHPWVRHISQKFGVFYVYNLESKQSEFEVRNNMQNRPTAAEATFVQAFKERVVWNWPHDSQGTLNMDALIEKLSQFKRT